MSRRIATWRGGALASLPRRAYLTVQYHGPREALWRAATFPLRFTPFAERVTPERRVSSAEARRAARWYGRHGRLVTVVIPTYGPPRHAIEAVASVRRTTDPARTRIVVVDDASAPEHQRALSGLSGAQVIFGEGNAGFAANVNRGLRGAQGDVVVLNSDVLAHRGWLERLQHAAYTASDIGVVGPRLLYPDGRIQSAGSHRNLGAPEWFDHRFRFAPAHFGPANVIASAIGVTGACMYLKRATIERVGLFDERYRMGFEDMDYCLRTWQQGLKVIYHPAAVLTHVESATRGMAQGERELDSQRHFWETWRARFDERRVRTPEGTLRIVYVTEGTGVGGGHRVVFEHLNRLAARGHSVELWTLGSRPDWFELDVPVRSFATYDALADELSGVEAIKVATWWTTAAPVWRASVLRGRPVYFVQDIETSYYSEAPSIQQRVLESYRQEFDYLTTSTWNRDQLRGMGHDATIVAPGVDLETFRSLGGERHEDVLLAVGRTNPLKDLPLTLAAWRTMGDGRPRLWMYGIEPHVAAEDDIRYVIAPSDEQVNALYNEAAAFVQTSRHEGFCLPLLEAMAAGAPVVCTDAHGNRDFCRDGVNCLLPDADPDAVARALASLFGDPLLRARLAEQGRATADEYAWEPLIDRLERFFEGVARAGPQTPLGSASARSLGAG